MQQTDWLTAVLDFKLDRAFYNLYDVVFDCSSVDSKNTLGGGIVGINDRLQSMTYYAEKLNFGGDFNFETEYSEATKQFFIKNAQRIKTITITFTETSTYKVVDVMKDWMNNIYDFVNNCFNKYDPRGTMYIQLDQIMDDSQSGVITVSNMYPTVIPYPDYNWAEGDPISLPITFVCDGVFFSQLPYNRSRTQS
jgi:hypothetical protein